jgi:hypothetical protein
LPRPRLHRRIFAPQVRQFVSEVLAGEGYAAPSICGFPLLPGSNSNPLSPLAVKLALQPTPASANLPPASIRCPRRGDRPITSVRRARLHPSEGTASTPSQDERGGPVRPSVPPARPLPRRPGFLAAGAMPPPILVIGWLRNGSSVLVPNPVWPLSIGFLRAVPDPTGAVHPHLQIGEMTTLSPV